MHTIALYVCTYRRNDELRRLLRSVEHAAAAVAGRAAVGVVVVDDNVDGRARGVAEEFEGRFPLGVRYRHVGGGNISRARNAGLDAAGEMADWVAMTDDDVVVPDDWFDRLLDVHERTGADAVTGPAVPMFEPSAPRWLREQPFHEIGLMPGVDDAKSDTGATNNSMIRASWLRDHPEHRFQEDLGVKGGEDMVFYRSAVAAGLDVRYSWKVGVREMAPLERSNLRYQLRRALWLGNSQYVTNLRLGNATRSRLVLRGGRRLLDALLRPLAQLRTGEPPQLRYAIAGAAEGLGFLVGAAGVELDHR